MHCTVSMVIFFVLESRTTCDCNMKMKYLVMNKSWCKKIFLSGIFCTFTLLLCSYSRVCHPLLSMHFLHGSSNKKWKCHFGFSLLSSPSLSFYFFMLQTASQTTHTDPRQAEDISLWRVLSCPQHYPPSFPRGWFDVPRREKFPL